LRPTTPGHWVASGMPAIAGLGEIAIVLI